MTLKTIQVDEYTVSQSNIRAVMLRNKLIAKVDEIIGAQPDMPDFEREIYQTYCMIASCVTPTFSIDEYMEMEEAKVMKLMNAFSELNAHLLGNEPEQEKKTQE